MRDRSRDLLQSIVVREHAFAVHLVQDIGLRGDPRAGQGFVDSSALSRVHDEQVRDELVGYEGSVIAGRERTEAATNRQESRSSHARTRPCREQSSP